MIGTLLIVVCGIIYFVSRTGKKIVLEMPESFPPIDDACEEEAQRTDETTVTVPLTLMVDAPKKVAKKKRIEAGEEGKRVTIASPKVVETVQTTSPYAIKSNSDARRAFIYSEIFNRKYE